MLKGYWNIIQKKKDWQMRLLSVIQIFIKIDPIRRIWSKKTGIATGTDIQGAMKKLEKYFYLDCGDYVYHKELGSR